MSTPAVPPSRRRPLPWLRLALVVLLLGAVVAGLWAALSRGSRRTVVSTLLTLDPSDSPLPTPKPTFDELLRFRDDQVALLRSRLVLQAALSDQRVSGLSILNSREDLVPWLEDRLEVDFPYPHSPEVLRVSLRGADAEELIPLADAIGAAFCLEANVRWSMRKKAKLEAAAEQVRAYEEKVSKVAVKQAEDRQFLASSNVTVRQVIREFNAEMLRAITRELGRIRVEQVLASARPKKGAKEQADLEVLAAQSKALEAERGGLVKQIKQLDANGTDLRLPEDDVTHLKDMLRQLLAAQERLRVEMAYPPRWRVLDSAAVQRRR